MNGLKKFLAAAILLFTLSSAWASDLQDAKAQGLVGEANTGYLAAVQQPASDEIKALVSSVNAKRKAHFEKTSRSTNTTMAQVSNRFYELAVEKTAPGHYYQDLNGRWIRK